MEGVSFSMKWVHFSQMAESTVDVAGFHARQCRGEVRVIAVHSGCAAKEAGLRAKAELRREVMGGRAWKAAVARSGKCGCNLRSER